MNIWPDTGYLARYWTSGRVLEIWHDAGYQAGYWISGRILDIWPDNKDNSKNK